MKTMVRFCGLLLTIILLARGEAEPLQVGSRKQVFLDQRFIGASERIHLQTNPAAKLGLLLDEAGERVQGHVSRVIDYEGVARLYVGADSVESLESGDGLHFRRTGQRIGGGIFTTPFLDLHDPDPARRWKAFWIEYAAPFDPAVHGVYAGYSADGVNFTKAGRVLPFYTDNPNIVYWDERIGKYVIYTRALALNSENQRRIARIEVDDVLKPWPYREGKEHTMFFTTENAEVVLAADEHDDPSSDIYYNAATLYPEAQDAYFMFTAQFRHFTPQRHGYIVPPHAGQWEDFGLLEIQLAVSRDGVAWSRPSREAYFPTGLADEWDRWYAVMAPGMVRRGNYLYQYYNSSGRTHDSAIVRKEYAEVQGLGGIGIVRQRVDGFVSADVDYQGGWLETPVLVFSGKRLRLNIDTGAMGSALVELRDADGGPIDGFRLEDCEEIAGNFIDQAVYWKGNPDVSTLKGREVKVYIRMKRAKLYSFQFRED